MAVSPINGNESFIAPSRIKWQPLQFTGNPLPVTPAAPVKKEPPQAGDKNSTNPFSVKNFNLNCPRRTVENIDFLV